MSGQLIPGSTIAEQNYKSYNELANGEAEFPAQMGANPAKGKVGDLQPHFLVAYPAETTAKEVYDAVAGGNLVAVMMDKGDIGASEDGFVVFSGKTVTDLSKRTFLTGFFNGNMLQYNVGHTLVDGEMVTSWTLTKFQIGHVDTQKVSVDASGWSGTKTYTLSESNGGKIVDFGSVPAAVTTLNIVTPNSVNTVLYQLVTASPEITINVKGDNDLPLPVKGMPDSFTAGNILQISVCNGVALVVEVEPVQTPLAMTPPPSSGEEQTNESEV